MTYAHKRGDYWAAMYVNRNSQWTYATDAKGNCIRCASHALALSVARYRCRRLKLWRN